MAGMLSELPHQALRHAVDGTQIFKHAEQTLYQLSHISNLKARIQLVQVSLGVPLPVPGQAANWLAWREWPPDTLWSGWGLVLGSHDLGYNFLAGFSQMRVCWEIANDIIFDTVLLLCAPKHLLPALYQSHYHLVCFTLANELQC